MIGRRIDRAALTALCTAALYGFFLNAGTGIIASAMLTFVCMALLRHLWRNRPGRQRATRAQAEAALLHIATMGEDEARSALLTLAERPDAVVLLMHPEDALPLKALFDLWRTQGDGIDVVVPCDAEPAAARFAKSRGIHLIDRGTLIRKIRKTGLYVTGETPRAGRTMRLRGLWSRVPVGPKPLLYSLALVAAYLSTGRLITLLCGLGLMGLTGAKLIEQKS